LHNITRVANPPKVEITDEKKLHAQYLTLVPEHWVIDKRKVAEDLKKGKVMEGAKLVHGEHLRIG
ncbi:siphovirus Gp157 family protein, partial [Candidatus Magnetobacterium casense]